MKLCPGHLMALEEALRDRGIFEISSDDNDELGRRVESQVKFGTTRENFDPFADCQRQLCMGAVNRFGAPLLNLDQHAEQCPLCYAKALTESNGGSWSDSATIELAASFAFTEATKLGLVASA